MATLAQLTAELSPGRPPDAERARAAARLLAQSEVADADKVAYLLALAGAGETAEVVAAFAETYRGMARAIELGDMPARAIDVVGTGGDRSGSFNISTASSLIVAAAGVPVMKHGNRSITSKSGSADFLAVLGINLEADDATLLRSLREANFCYFFAPAFHPAFRAVGAARRQLAEGGHKTVFNVLGPLVNPGRPAHMLVGVYAERWVEPVAGALEALGVRRGLVTHGKVGDGMDELTTAGPARVRGVGELRNINATWLPGDHGFRTCDPRSLLGGSAEQNVATFGELLLGAADEGLADTVFLSAGTALWVAGAAAGVEAGASRARELAGDGTVRETVRRLRDLYRS